jgi:hypothetical protein
MASARKDLAELRRQLAERFPTAARPPGRALSTGISAIDDATGGLPLGAVTEIVCTAPSCGSQLFLGQLLAVTRTTRTRVGLIDATDAFDPDSFSADLLTHLVWVRCPTDTPASAKITATALALQAADLLARDANLGLVVLDLRYAPAADLRRIPGPQWYRFQRAVEPTDLAFVVLTPRPSVPSAQFRLVLHISHDQTAFARERPVLTAPLSPTFQRQRLQVSAG